MSYRHICLIAFFIGWFNNLKAQEEEFLDDSTQDVHGLHTTFFFTAADLKYNRSHFRPVSVDIEKIDRFTFRQRMAYKVQDLGNEGTATKYVFYTLPKKIGAHAGFYVYDMYFKDPLQQKYYDAKVPYTDGSVVFANYGSYFFEVCHTRSFNKNWHLGTIFESMLIDREYIPSKIPYDRQVITYPFTVFGHYKSDNECYQALVSFYRKDHRTRETGGISSANKENNIFTEGWLKAKADIKNNLSIEDSIESKEFRHQYYLYHQVACVKPLQLYHEVVLRNTFNYFTTKNLKPSSKQFLAGDLLGDQNSIQDSTIMQTLSSEIGIKGQINRIFYQYYYQRKQINLQQVNLPKTDIQEHYLGFYTRINVRDNVDFIHLSGEYLRGDLYKIHSSYRGSLLELSYDEVKYAPSLLSLRYESPYRNWNKKFKPPLDRQLEGACHILLPGLLLRPYGRLIRTKSPIYFKKSKHTATIHTIVEPCQENGHATIKILGTNANLTLWSYFHIDMDIAFTQVQGQAANTFQMPTWYTNIRTYYAQNFYAGNSAIETGIDFNWKSSYNADGYDPITQQFYRQDDFSIYAYPILEVFFNFRIKTFRGFVKVVHANQGLPTAGYFVTPLYPGQLRSVDLGVSWSLFD